jgi:hypothetical protein
MSLEAPNNARSVGGQPHVVIAYGYADHEFAHRLAGALRRDGVSPWIDEVDMSAGVILTNRIAFAVRPVDFIFPIISESSVNAGWVRRELRSIIARNPSRHPLRVLPARIDVTVLPEHLMSQSYIDFHGHGWQRAYDDLRVLIQPGATPRPGVPPPRAVEPPRPVRRQQTVPPRHGSQQKIVYVAYDHDHDGYYKDILLTWANSPDFPRIVINDQPPAMPVDSAEAEPVKRMIAARVGEATGFLCVVGPRTNENRWVEWETRTAIELDKRLVVVRVNRDCAAPEVLAEVGPTCALSFTFEGIKRAIDEAYGVVAAE